MSWRYCNCPRCKIRGLTGPAVLITIGVLFFLNQYDWRFSFGRLWPVILIVIGVIQLLCATASSEGHVSRYNQWQVPPQTPPQTPPQGSQQK
jgi:LiaI-LiaF-like transmembrane region